MSSGKISFRAFPRATCIQRALPVAFFHNVDFDMILVDILKGEHKTPEYKKLQPFGQIPVMHDGEFTLYESRAIARYLEKKFAAADGNHQLYPTDLQKAALVDQWISVETDNFAKPACTVALTVWRPNPDPNAVPTAKKTLEGVLDIYNAHLATSKFLAGEEFTLADIFHLSYLNLIYHSKEHAELVTSRPNVERWLKECFATEAWQKTLAYANKQ